MHHQRRRADRDQVIDRHRDGVLGDAGIPAATGQRGHLVGHQGFGAQALDDRSDVERADVHHIRRLSSRSLYLAEAMSGQVPGGGGGGALCADLQWVDQVVVDAGLLIAEGAWVGGGR